MGFGFGREGASGGDGFGFRFGLGFALGFFPGAFFEDLAAAALLDFLGVAEDVPGFFEVVHFVGEVFFLGHFGAVGPFVPVERFGGGVPNVIAGVRRGGIVGVAFVLGIGRGGAGASARGEFFAGFEFGVFEVKPAVGGGFEVGVEAVGLVELALADVATVAVGEDLEEVLEAGRLDSRIAELFEDATAEEVEGGGVEIDFLLESDVEDFVGGEFGVDVLGEVFEGVEFGAPAPELVDGEEDVVFLVNLRLGLGVGELVKPEVDFVELGVVEVAEVARGDGFGVHGNGLSFLEGPCRFGRRPARVLVERA